MNKSMFTVSFILHRLPPIIYLKNSQNPRKLPQSKTFNDVHTVDSVYTTNRRKLPNIYYHSKYHVSRYF